MELAQPTKVLITVMTYPHPSRGYQELVCTAGITEDGEWVRLYPVDYRYRERNQQFKKYQWIEVRLDASGSGNDNRKESRRPDLDSIRLVGEPLDTKYQWRDRREIIDRLPHYTRNQLSSLYQHDKTSLGVVRPSRVLDMEVHPTSSKWKPEWQNLSSQLTLFGPPQKPLRKIPYTFHYVFECDDSDGKKHTAMCEDWELGMLFLHEVDRLGSDEKVAESVREKFLNELCRDDKDTRFFMGTYFPYNTWLVLGVFWPPKVEQPLLF
ncbi:MAG: hypothetical protein SGJ20_15545 [Planctomycetota bacterium]|nr:hypothetical protein [Planctomycetota bacterium]